MEKKQNKQDERKKRKTRAQVLVRDLKAKRDAKGGFNPQPDPPGGRH